jgi:hypothetical protein
MHLKLVESSEVTPFQVRAEPLAKTLNDNPPAFNLIVNPYDGSSEPAACSFTRGPRAIALKLTFLPATYVVPDGGPTNTAPRIFSDAHRPKDATSF